MYVRGISDLGEGIITNVAAHVIGTDYEGRVGRNGQERLRGSNYERYDSNRDQATRGRPRANEHGSSRATSVQSLLNRS